MEEYAIKDNYRSEEGFNNDKNSSTNTPSTQNTYDKHVNKEKNKEKIFFWKFLINTTKAEMNYDQFGLLLFWNSILEITFFLLSLLFFIWGHGLVLILLFHLIRGLIGIWALVKLPLTHQIIESLDGFENDSLESITAKLNNEFAKLLENAQGKTKALLVIYFILTIICIITDVIGIILVITELKATDDAEQYFFIMTLLFFLLCKTIFIFSYPS